MRPQRGVLVVGAALFVVSSTHYVGAQGPWEVEGNVYGGSASGHMACGPDVRVAYGGLGGEVRYLGVKGAGQNGIAADLGGVVEDQRMQPIHCLGTQCNGGTAEGWAPGARARAGYDWTSFGFRVGALVWTAQNPGGPQAVLVPDVNLRFGRMDRVRVVGGFGAYDFSTYERPGFYCGLLVASHGWEVGLYGGEHLEIGNFTRETVTVRAPLGRGGNGWWIRSSVALMESRYGAGGDSTLGIGADW
jgi:hypothetical protein